MWTLGKVYSLLWTASSVLGALISPNDSTNIKPAIRPKVQLWLNGNCKCRGFLQPIATKTLVLLTECQPPSYQKTAWGKHHYHWRHETAAGWRRQFNFKLKESSSSQPQATLSAHILCRSWIQTEDESLSYLHFKNHQPWLELEKQHALRRPEGSFFNSLGAFHGLSDSSRRSQEENRGIRPLLVVGLGMPCVLGVLFGLICWFLFGVCFGFLKED